MVKIVIAKNSFEKRIQEIIKNVALYMGFEISTGGKFSNVAIKPIWETHMKILHSLVSSSHLRTGEFSLPLNFYKTFKSPSKLQYAWDQL